MTSFGSDPAALESTGAVFRFLIRRDRVRLALWVVGLVAVMAASAGQLPALYDDQQAIEGYVNSVGDNPALVMFAGPGYGFDSPNIGVILVNETSLWMGLACGLMSIFVINRATRLEEDNERADLVRAGVVGRHAPTVAALALAATANAVVAVASFIACVATGFAVVGSVALSASIGLMGVAFAGVGLVTAQVAPNSRANLGSAGAAMGVWFFLRGIGDIAAPALRWLSPFGWAIGVRAFAGERWWTLLGLVVFTLATTVLAFRLSERRDLGSGLFPPRPGSAAAPSWMGTPFGLTARLQRGAVIGWSVGLFATGLIYGSIGDEIEALLRDNPQLADFLAAMGGASLADAFLATSASMLAMLGAGFAVSSLLRLRSGEQAGWAEFAVTGVVSRLRWATAHLAVTAIGTVIVLVVAGAGAGAGYAAVTGDGSQIFRLIAAELVLLPAVMVLVGVSLMLVGWARRATMGAWLVFAVIVAVGVFGELLGLPASLRSWSPFERTPALPAETMRWTPVLGLCAVALVLSGLGLVGFSRRDLDTK